jgi:membrane-bound serine protease (ClpP class)
MGIAGTLGRFFLAIGAALALASALTAQEAPPARFATVVSLDGPVTPASASYVTRGIDAANEAGHEFVLMEIDTPGGLVDSMKTIVKAMLASEVPVVTYVYPDGARSASAGLYIMYAADVSAMAPNTNTGSATPIEMGGAPSREAPTDGEEGAPDLSNEASMRGKVIEDSVAYIRALAESSGRNAEWAEKAVRPPSANVTASEALALGVIEIVAADTDDLLAQLDGRQVVTAAGPREVETEGLRLVRVERTLLESVLGFFANPNVAAILLTLGTTGLIVELWNPGSIFPGVFGAICLGLAFYSFQVLPFEGLYLGLLALGAVLIVVEAFTPTFGLVGLTGLGLVGFGLYFLFPGELRVGLGVIVALLAVAGALLGMTLLAFMRSRAHGPMIGGEAIRRREGRVETWDGDAGWVIVDGERWRARSKQPLSPGDRIRVTDTDGLVLIVKTATGPLGRPQKTPARPGPSGQGPNL